MDDLNQEQRRRNMQAIRSKDTKIERVLAKALWSRGYRYRKNDKTVFGKPDFTFKRHKVAVFVDSEFWHGKNWETQKERIGTNRDYWLKKIENNIARDKKVNESLTTIGWIVLRFWGKEVEKNLESCVERLENELNTVKIS